MTRNYCMVAPSFEEILAYAKDVKKQYPKIDADGLKKNLESKFMVDNDMLLFIIDPPPRGLLLYFLSVIIIIKKTFRKIFMQDKDKIYLREQINKAIAELQMIK